MLTQQHLRAARGLLAYLAGFLVLLFAAPAVQAQVPPGCSGSGLGISLNAFLDSASTTPARRAHIGDTIWYTALIYNRTNVCTASNVVAYIIPPNGVTNKLNLVRTVLAPGEAELIANVLTYVIREQDIGTATSHPNDAPLGTVNSKALDIGEILQNIVPSQGGGFQEVNTWIDRPGIQISATCASGTGENGVITFNGTVANSGNVTLTNVTVMQQVGDSSLTVLGPVDLAVGQSATFSGSWVPKDPCAPSTATLTARGTDISTMPLTVTSSTSVTCQNVLTPGIAVTKACPELPVAPGQPLVFSGTVRNTGNITLKNVLVVNDLPAPGTQVFTAKSLAPGETLSFTGSYAAPTNCTTTSTLTATAASICGPTVSHTASSTCPIVTLPQIDIAAACTSPNVIPGGTATYSGTVRNTGNITLTDVVVVSDRPAANTTVFSVASLAPGAVATFTGSYTIPADLCAVTANLVATGKDQCTTTPVSKSASATCTTTSTPRIAVTLVCPTTAVNAGAPITYSGTVSNPGNVTLRNVVVTNPQATPNTVFTVESLAAGASANFNATFTAPTDTCSVSSSVTARGRPVCSEEPVTASASATCPLVTTPGIAITQNCPEGSAIPGGVLTYNGTVRNTGNVTLTNVIVLNDRTGATPVFTAQTLAPGASATFTGSYTAPVNTCSVTSTSGVRATSICGVAVNSSVSSTCTILTAPSIVVTANCSTNTVAPGGVLTYGGTVSNAGNITLTNVVVVSDRPAPNTQVFTIASLAPGASSSFTATYTVPANAVCSVTARLVATGKDVCTGNGVTDAKSTICPVTASPRIAVTLNCPATSVATGGAITYSGTVSNTGDDTLNEVVVVSEQTTPKILLAVPSLAPGASTNFTATFTAPADACSVTCAVAASGTGACSQIKANNTASATCNLITAPGIAITQNCPEEPATSDGTITYHASVRNTGNVTLTNVTVFGHLGAAEVVKTNVLWFDDALPAGAAPGADGGDSWNWVSSNPSPFSGTKAHQSNLSAGFHQHFFTTGTAPFSIETGDILITYVYLDPANRPSEIMLQWHDGSYWEHRAYWGEDIIRFGNSSTTRTNMGALPPAGQWVRLEVPASAIGMEGRTAYGMAFTLQGGRATWDTVGKLSKGAQELPPATQMFSAAKLAPGEAAQFTASYTVPAASGCSISSTLVASGRDKCTGIAVTANVATTCPLLTQPAIEVTQTCPTAVAVQGGILTYSGTVKNAGNITLSNIVVLNNRPAENTVVFTAASLAPGASANFTGSYTVPTNCCSVWSTVMARGQDCSGITVHDMQTHTCPVQTTPRLVVTKVCPVLPVEPGALLKYSGTVSNAGNIALMGVVVVNDHPAPNTPVLGPITLAPGESVAYQAAYVVPTDFCGTDVVTARGYDACSDVGVENSVETTCPVVTLPRIAVTHSCPPDPTPKGGVHVFSGAVSNPGPVTLKNVYVVMNQPTNNTPILGPITLAPGASKEFTASYVAPTCCCEFGDTVTARGQDLCSNAAVSATSSVVCPVLTTPHIAVTRVCGATPKGIGELFTYRGLVKNTGDVVLTNVYVYSSQPVKNTPVLGPIELAPGESQEFSGSYELSGSDPIKDTVRAVGMDLCQSRQVSARADCNGPIEDAVAPVVNAIAVTEGVVRISWTATPGVTYAVQYKSTVHGFSWKTLPGNVTATGTTASKEDAVSDSQRIYRVMVIAE